MSGSTIYAGGGFDLIGGKTRHGVAALDAATGAATRWNPDVVDFQGYTGRVSALAVRGSTLYVGGDFTSIGGVPQANFAAFSSTSRPD